MGRRPRSQVLGRLAWWRIRTRKESRGDKPMTVRGNPWQCGVLEAKYFQLIWLGFVNLAGSKITWETSHQAHLEVSDCDSGRSPWLDGKPCNLSLTDREAYGWEWSRLVHVKASPRKGEMTKVPSATIFPTFLCQTSQKHLCGGWFYVSVFG